TVQEIPDPILYPNATLISIDGGATMQIAMHDGNKSTLPTSACDPTMGINDTISIYVLNKKGGVWFANELDNTLHAVQVPLYRDPAQCPPNGSYSGDIIVK